MSLKTVDIKGKPYVQVNVRIKEFRKLFPDGKILTEMLSNAGEYGKRVCIFKSCVFVGGELVATGHAFEDESNGYINKTSYVENCETSAIGRALGVLGIGIDESIASAEEVTVAQHKQNLPNESNNQMMLDESKRMIAEIYKDHKDKWMEILLEKGKMEHSKGEFSKPKTQDSILNDNKLCRLVYDRVFEEYQQFRKKGLEK